MKHPKPTSGKSYSEVMNEWAAQRNLVNADRSRLLHPPYHASPAAKFFGYLFRLSLVTLVPAGIYLALVHSWLQSKEFNTVMSEGLARTLGAEQVVTRGAGWKTDGILSLQSLKATGTPDAFYAELEGQNLGTRLPFAALLRRNWVLHRISMEELSIALRSGGRGSVPVYQSDEEGATPALPGGGPAGESPKTGARGRPHGGLLRAGYGISPDFNTLTFNEIQTAKLNAIWGASPATSGALTQMQTSLTRTTSGWTISGNGGEFRQGWFGGVKVDKFSAKVGATEALVEEFTFSPVGGGKGSVTGRLSLGEVPELDGGIHLEGVALQEMLPPAAAALFTATGSGTLKLSGSVNRTTGIKMEGDLEVESGRLSGLPVLKALNQLTNEDQFRLLTFRSGRVRLATSGSASDGGLIVELKEIEADCGPSARITGHLKYEQTRGLAIPGGEDKPDTVTVTGLLRLGLSPEVASHLKAAVVERFLKREERGWWWLDLKVDGPLDNTFSKNLSDQMLKVSAGAP